MTQHARDDGFHEIQLNGKQLVFLFMAATVVSVVIFLCGVLVGRGVPPAAPVETASTEPASPPAFGASHQSVTTPAGSDPTAAAAPPPDLTYPESLGGRQPTDEARTAKKSESEAKKAEAEASRAKPSVPAPAPPAKSVVEAAPQPVTEKVPERSVASAAPEASGAGFALQVTALRERNEAEAIAKRLSTKGYAAYVLTPAAGAPPVYRVRVGKFKTRREAETIAAKLQKEEQFSPWITR